MLVVCLHSRPQTHRVTVMAKCFGPDASAVMKGRLMSVLVVLLSSHLACGGNKQCK
jgi:hypothetical protein